MPDPDPASPNCINGWRSRIFACASSGMTVNILKHLIQSFENRPQTHSPQLNNRTTCTAMLNGCQFKAGNLFTVFQVFMNQLF